MTARILPLNSEEHRIAQELLPWFVNGTLDAAETAQVAAHLAQCGVCQADVAVQSSLRSAPVDAASSGDVDRAWAALRSRIDLPTRALSRGAMTAGAWWRRGLQLAVAIQAVVILVLSVALFSLLAPAEPFRALGAAPAVEANALAVFRADATEAQVRAALRAAGARIVDGPTSADAYLLRLADAAPATLARLRAQPGVASVESLEGEPAR